MLSSQLFLDSSQKRTRIANNLGIDIYLFWQIKFIKSIPYLVIDAFNPQDIRASGIRPLFSKKYLIDEDLMDLRSSYDKTSFHANRGRNSPDSNSNNFANSGLAAARDRLSLIAKTATYLDLEFKTSYMHNAIVREFS